MNFKNILPKKKKGVAGLEILLSVVSILFVLGLLVMVFVLTGAEIQDTDVVENDATALQVVNDTTTALSSVIDWFPIIIVLAAVVVLILMAVLIISAIRGTGMMGGGPVA